MRIVDSDEHLYESRSLWRDHIDPKARDAALAIEDDVGDAGRVVDEQRPRPGRAAVGRLVQSAVAAASADLMVLGAATRPHAKRAFFGSHVEAVLAEAPCPVAVLLLPA